MFHVFTNIVEYNYISSNTEILLKNLKNVRDDDAVVRVLNGGKEIAANVGDFHDLFSDLGLLVISNNFSGGTCSYMNSPYTPRYRKSTSPAR